MVLVNQIELTSQVRALLVTAGMDARVLTYCHYWPVLGVDAEQSITWDDSLNHSGLAEVILLRILEATLTCDAMFVTSTFAKTLLQRAGRHYNIRINERKIHILPCPADPDLLTCDLREFRGRKTVLYNHRLYRQYGTDFLLDVIHEFRGTDVQFVITDFLGKRIGPRAALDPDIALYRAELRTMDNVIVRSDGDDRVIYRNEILADADIGLAPYRKNANWSMSTIDCMGTGIPVICPNCASFPEFALPGLLFNTKKEAVELINRLFDDASFWRHCSTASQAAARRFSADYTAAEFSRIVSALDNEHIDR